MAMLLEQITDQKIGRQVAYTKKLPDAHLAYVVDFFSGCGGMSYGFANTRQSHCAYKVLAGIDIDETALLTYRRNIDGSRAICSDIFKISEDPGILLELIPELNLPECRPLVFIGCAPCQGFSAHRKKDHRDDPRNSLMVAFARICMKFKPDVLVMENVPEILGGRYSQYFDIAANILSQGGYKLSQGVLDLSRFGIPQRRKRAIVIGSTKEKIDLPSPVFEVEHALTVRHAISHLAHIDAGSVDTYDFHHKAPDHTERILERIRKTPPDGGDRRSLSEADQLACHSCIDDGGTPGFTDVYGRLRWDTPSVTITAKSSTPSCGRFLHPDQHRNISVREAAILQGFPQNFIFEGPFANQYRQIGEAVPPLFSRFLASHILGSLFGHKNQKTFEKLRNKMSASVGKKTSHSAGLSIVDGFCGAGGIALGFKYAGFESSFAFDIDQDAVRTFSRNISPISQCWDVSDIRLVKEIDSRTSGKEYVIAGGAPCQGFSQQRRGEDNDPRNNLVLAYSKLVGELSTPPVAIVLENVTYLDSPRGRAIFHQYIEEIESQGYITFRHDLNSADFGVPQLRRRIIVVALKPEMARHYSGPKPLTDKCWPTVGEALSSLVNLPAEIVVPNHAPSLEGHLNRRRISYVDMGSGRLAIPPNLQLSCHKKYGGHLDVYGRLDWFSQARTITGGFDSFTRGEYAHPFFHRSITPREAARLQGFPDWFFFEGNKASIRRQIGNAVPPTMAYAVGKAIADAFKEITRR